MPGKNTVFYSLILMAVDSIVLGLAFWLAYLVRVSDPKQISTGVSLEEYLLSVLLIIPFWVMFFIFLGLYKSTTYNRRLAEWSKLAVGSIIGILLVIGFEYFAQILIFPAKLIAIYSLLGSFLLLLIGREVLRSARSIAFHLGHGTSRVLIIGNSAATKDIAKNLAETAKSGYKIVAFAGPKRLIPKKLEVIHFSSIFEAVKKIKELEITTIIQTDLYDSVERNHLILGAAQENHIGYNFIPGEAEFYTGKNTIDIFLGYPMISVSQTPLIGWGEVAKRVFDVSLIILSSPLWVIPFLILMLFQKIFNPGPIFFSSSRIGLHGKSLSQFKFRSMSPKYSGVDPVKVFKELGRDDLIKEFTETRKIKDDPRITKFGSILRRTSLDELPQIWNVLRGDMSLVGPRPITKSEQAYYKSRMPLFSSVRPGITGLWQVSGRSDLSSEQRVELELFYAQNWSFWLDIKILFKTLGVVLRREGAK